MGGGSNLKITVVGVGFYGSTLAQRIAERGYADEVVMTDIIEDRPQGLALDMMQSRSIEGFETRIVGTNGYEETAGSDVCVITAGMARKPGMSRMDLREVNAKIVDEAAIDELVQKTRDGGAEIVGLLKTGSAYYAPSSAAEAMVRAVVEDSGALMPVCAWVDGQYGIKDVYLGVPAKLGRGGVIEIV